MQKPTNEEIMAVEYQREDMLQQQEYETRVKVWTTDFKDNTYLAPFNTNFAAAKFVGTEKEYDEATKMYDNHDNGKIIGIQSYTLEEWDEMHPPVEYKEKEYTKLDKYFDDILEERKKTEKESIANWFRKK